MDDSKNGGVEMNLCVEIHSFIMKELGSSMMDRHDHIGL